MLPSRRISLECPVVDAAGLQEWAHDDAVKAGASLKPSSDYHLTVLHLGRPAEIFEAVRSAAGDRRASGEDYFADRLRNWLQAHVKTLRHSVSVASDGLLTLGSAKPYALACRISALPPEVRDLHDGLLSSFAHFLHQELGVADGASFMRLSPVFGYSGKSWVPHITIGQTEALVEVRLPTREVRLSPMRVRNGDVLGLYNSEPI